MRRQAEVESSRFEAEDWRLDDRLVKSQEERVSKLWTKVNAR